MAEIAPPPHHAVEDAVARALAEDFGDAGDLTGPACLPAEAAFAGVVAARAPGVVAGLPAALCAFRQVDPAIHVQTLVRDGARVAPGEALLRVDGSARSVLAAERVALNFLGRLSGVATATAALVDAVAGTNARIACTRKTTPGLRALEKYAVRCGGGTNHRFGLYDAVMIKDNHIAAAGGVAPALRAARAHVGHVVKIEIEVDAIDQLAAVLAAPARETADVVLLDNMTPEQLREAVAINAGRLVLEASGSVTAQTVRAIAETGVDVISSGAITHSATTLDVGLDAADAVPV
ncbi:MAG: carboxylating nicotinate-nucleotide diphosphorylase [Pseudomonadota bacterium]